MKTENAVELRNVSVCYRLYTERSYSLKENFVRKAHQLTKVLRGETIASRYRELWALREINLDLKKGASLGIIGRNGSGKSTMLKVIAGVLHPTEGALWVRGRVSALVELGAGFDPDLTGRENVYFGASVAGLSRKETDKRLDRIIEFSELADFIDVPVKNYSSGMYARLGFALATDVDPDILIIDELLSVGDAAFQEKCFTRMNEFRARNKTILFVSHNADQTTRFCDTILHLDAGRPVDGPVAGGGVGNRLEGGT